VQKADVVLRKVAECLHVLVSVSRFFFRSLRGIFSVQAAVLYAARPRTKSQLLYGTANVEPHMGKSRKASLTVLWTDRLGVR